MKKILSFMLVLAMLAMMCINVSAANCDTHDKDHVVGTVGHNGNYEDGTDSTNFSEESEEMTIGATINGTVTPRYAVDLVYTSVEIEVTTTSDWDVNQLKYVGDTVVKVNGSTVETFSDANVSGKITGVGSFSVINYSNGVVYVSAEANNIYNATNNTISFEILDDAGNDIISAASDIDAVTVTPGKSSSAVPASYTANVTCTDWQSTFATADEQEIVLATITFTIAATNN